jgi:spermidine synthase
VIPWRELDRAVVPEGEAPLVLVQRGSEFVIRLGARALMGSQAHGSEEALAEIVCGRIAHRPGARVLVGGLGMGFTLAAALARLQPDARLVVAELIPAVVTWNRGPLADLASRPLEDPRVAVIEDDVAGTMRDPASYDAIILDVDNGPNGLTRDANDRLYSRGGLERAFTSLRDSGVLGVWSVAPDRGFSRRLGAVGFVVEEQVVRARRTRGGRHTLWVATRPPR